MIYFISLIQYFIECIQGIILSYKKYSCFSKLQAAIHHKFSRPRLVSPVIYQYIPHRQNSGINSKFSRFYSKRGGGKGSLSFIFTSKFSNEFSTINIHNSSDWGHEKEQINKLINNNINDEEFNSKFNELVDKIRINNKMKEEYENSSREIYSLGTNLIEEFKNKNNNNNISIREKNIFYLGGTPRTEKLIQYICNKESLHTPPYLPSFNGFIADQVNIHENNNKEKLVNKFLELYKSYDSKESYVENNFEGFFGYPPRSFINISKKMAEIYPHMPNKEDLKEVNSDNKEIYVIAFNLIKSKDSQKLSYVYNYIRYNYIFCESFLYYLAIVQNIWIINSKENVFGNSYFFMLNDELEKLNGEVINILNNLEEAEYPILFKKDEYINKAAVKHLPFTELFKAQIKGKLISASDIEFIKFLNFLKDKNLAKAWEWIDKYSFMLLNEDFYNAMTNAIKERVEKRVYEINEVSNPVNRIIYVTNDLNKFIKSFENDGIVISQGPQKSRGEINDLDHVLTYFDREFRNFLRILANQYIPETKNKNTLFGFKNINLNWGVRRRNYSTINRKIDEINIYSILSRNYSNKKVIKVENSPKFPRKLSAYLLEIKEIIKKNKNDREKAQLLIEEKWKDLSFHSINYSEEIYKNQNTIIIKAFNLLKMYLDNRVLNNFKSIIDYIVDIRYVSVTFMMIMSYSPRMMGTNLRYHIGRAIIKSIYENNFQKKSEMNSYRDFLKVKNINEEYYIKLGNLFMDLFIHFTNPVFDEETSYEQKKIVVNNDYVDEVKNNLIISPQSLPMLCKPKMWSEDKRGGFLLNYDEYDEITAANGLVIGSKQHGHSINFQNSDFDAINYLNNLEYKVNKDLVEYLENDGWFILEYYRENKFDQFINNIITLDIAKTYIDSSFHLTTRVDWRGRIYTESFYLDYQGSEFSLALINMNSGRRLNNSGKYYLYIYGATVYNEGGIVAKKEFNERYKWVEENLQNIYLMEREFILNAESPTVFSAFCLNMKRLRDSPNSTINFPVFLDATCSGVQHFAAMLRDVELAKQVNLINSENINDFYSALLPEINKAINEHWINSKMKFSKMKDIKFKRSDLKKILMAKNYNISLYGVVEELKSVLEKIPKKVIYKNKEITVYDYKIPANNKKKYVIVDLRELQDIASIIYDNIFTQFPELDSIFKYLTLMAKILLKLNLPIVWLTPTGLELKQSYNLSEIHKLTITLVGKSKTIVLRKWTDEIDKRRGVHAIIPNIIHSLDASHLLLVIKNWEKTGNYLLPIHDCFGTHPNDMGELSDVVRAQFVILYGNQDFLKNLDDTFRSTLERYGVKQMMKNDKNCIIIEYEKKRSEYIELPQLPIKGMLDINKVLHSKYMIS